MNNDSMKGKRRQPFNKGIAAEKRADKVARAETRKAISSQRKPTERLAILDKKLGIGVGAEHERLLLKNFLVPIEKHQEN